MNLFRTIAYRIWGLIVHSSTTWEQIAHEFPTKQMLNKQFVWPTIFVCVLFEGVFGFMYASDKALQIGFLQAIVTAFSLFGGFFIACKGCYAYLDMKYPKQFLFEDCVKVVAYSFSVTFVLQLVTAVFPSLFFLQILNFFTAYLVWEACRTVFNIPEAERGSIVLVFSLQIVLISPLLARLFKLLLPNVQL